MKRSAKRSVCPIACSLDLFGDKWTLLVIRDLFAGKRHYHEFAKSPEGIATNILAERLERLCAGGIVSAKESDARAGSMAYELTDKGRTLYPVLVAMRDWGLANIRGTEARIALGS